MVVEVSEPVSLIDSESVDIMEHIPDSVYLSEEQEQILITDLLQIAEF